MEKANYQPLEEIIYNNNHKLDIFWQQRLLRKHKDLDEFKHRLMLCLGYYHGKYCDQIIQELREKDALKQFVNVE